MDGSRRSYIHTYSSHTTSNLHEAEQNDYTIKHHKRSTLLSQNATFTCNVK